MSKTVLLIVEQNQTYKMHYNLTGLLGQDLLSFKHSTSLNEFKRARRYCHKQSQIRHKTGAITRLKHCNHNF